MRRLSLVVSMLAAMSASLFAQVTTGTISGSVKDSSGAVLPAASLSIRNTDTGSERSVSSDVRGYFSAPNLGLGQYEITVTAQGFQTEVRRGISLNLGQTAVVDFTLKVGSVSERVEVTADAPLIETTTASVAGLVNERQVQDLPLNARNLLELAPLYSGVAFANTGERSASKGFATKLTIAGTRYNSSLFQLDGIDINDTANSAGGAAGILMGAETIREFNVITNGYSAEYGKHTGGVFNAVTKSGTNTLHGSLFEFLRNEKLDARNFFDGPRKPGFKRNQYGGSIGGPVARDHTFYFGSYEGLRERLGLTTIRNVPTANLRQGILPNGQQTNIAASVRPFLDSFPLPNGAPRSVDDGTREWTSAQGFPTNEDFFTIRVDTKIGSKDSIFGRYSFDDAANAVGSTAFTSSVNTNTQNDSQAHYIALGDSRLISPTLINQFLAGFSRSDIAQANTPVEGATFPLQNFTGRQGSYGSITVPAFSNWGGVSTYPRRYLLNLFQAKDDLYYTAGAHSLKFGFNAERLQFNHNEPFQGAGTFAFNSIQNFLAGTVNTFTALTLASDPVNYVRQTIYGIYAQDDYRLTARLTLNLGLRYEFTTTPVDKYGRVVNLRDFVTPGQTFDRLVTGNPSFLNPSLKNFAPRVGLAWDPFGNAKTSIRAGGGIFHDQINAGTFVFSFLSSPPYFVVGNILGTGGVTASFPNAFFSQQSQLVAQPNIEGFQYKADQPTVYKYSSDIQHEFMKDTSIDLGFSGTRATHLPRVLLMNMPAAQNQNGRIFIASNAPLLHPAFGRIRPRFTDVTSSYYALRISLNRRFSRGLQFQSSYTWSKTIDDGSNFTGSSDFTNSPGQARYLALKETALAPFDIRHNWVANATYDLPGKQLGGVTGAALGSWQISTIITMQSGNPFSATSGVQPAFMRAGFVGDYPDAVGPVHYDTRNVQRYFDPSGFAVPQATTAGALVGNAGRGTLIGPGLAKLDVVLVREVHLREGLDLQIRSEFFNLLNRANFGFPDGRVFANANGALSSSVGRITDTRTTSRQIQFGLRLAF